MSMIKINGVEIHDPQTLDFTLQDFDSEESERNAMGTLNRTRICSNKRSLQLTFPLLSNEEVSKILNLITPVFFNVTFFDPLQNKEVTIEMNAGDKNFGCYRMINGKGKWQGLSFSLIER